MNKKTAEFTLSFYPIIAAGGFVLYGSSIVYFLSGASLSRCIQDSGIVTRTAFSFLKR